MRFFFSQSSSENSPVVGLQPQHPSQPYNMNCSTPFTNASPFGQPLPTPAFSSQSQPPTPLSAAGRKRSRDEAADNLEEDYFTTVVPPVQESEEDWEYGEGMTLIKPNGFIIDASSQTGTWAEEEAELSQAQAQAQMAPILQDRPVLRSHKSQRLGLTATPVIAEEVNLSSGSLIGSSPPKSSIEPTVDAFTIHLGIGWSRISDDEDIQAAARGWARFIENHFPVSDVHIRLQSRGLASYLVETRQGWFLFGEDLKEGRLVSTSLERTFEHLKPSPPLFEGEHILAAAVETSLVDVSAKQEIEMNDAVELHETGHANVDSATFGNQTLAQGIATTGTHKSNPEQDLEMDMDMS